jgi:hypothetical protein
MRNVFLLTLLTCWSTWAQAQRKEISSATSDWVKVKPATPPKPDLTTADQPTAPTFTWQMPIAERSEHKLPTLTISVCVQSADTATRYQVYRNGVPVGGLKRGAKGFRRVACGHEIKEEVPLEPGANTIYVTATNQLGTATCAMRFVTYESISSPGQKRIALVIANQDYKKYPLKNPISDATAIRKQLEELGFTVTFESDQNRLALHQTVDRFIENLQSANVGLVFYAGHGMMVNNSNYIQPIDVDPRTEVSATFDCYPLTRLVAEMKAANPNGTNLVFWDACRNNPYRSWRRGAGDPTYTLVQPPSGTMIIYATEPNTTALDDSPFTSTLIKYMATPGLELISLIKKMHSDLRSRSISQVPYYEGVLPGDFFFKP